MLHWHPNYDLNRLEICRDRHHRWSCETLIEGEFNVIEELFDGIVLNQVYVIPALAYSADNIDLCAQNLFFLPTVKFSPHSAGYLLGRSCLLLMLNNSLTHLVVEEHQCDRAASNSVTK